MNQEQILDQIFISFTIDEKNKIIFNYGSDNPDKFQNILSIINNTKNIKMNQEQILDQIFISLPMEEKNKIIFKYGSDNPDNFQTILSIFTRSSKTEEEIQEIFVSKQPPLTLSDLQTDSEDNEPVDESVFPPGTVTIRRYTDSDLKKLNQLTSAERRREISKLNLNDRDHDHLINKLWRLRNPDRVRRNSKRAYQKRRRSLNDNNLPYDQNHA
jgi:hypothetical protein